MVNAGIKNINILGAILKKTTNDASPISITLLFPGNTHKKIPVAIKKTIMEAYPIIELKNDFISLMNKGYIS
tara:strand:- start:1620 stop:1835 length:216 start_codon:yes stop_codon:yes gene_type:complete